MHPLNSPKASQRIKRLRSFTLIELLLVILLLSLIVGLAVPSFRSSYTNLTLSETSKNIAFLMRYAQGRAVAKNKKHLLKLDLENSQYQLLEENLSSDELQDSTENLAALEQEGEQSSPAGFTKVPGRLGGIFHLPSEIKLETDIPEPTVLFYPDGKIDKVRIYVHDDRHRYFTISTKEQIGYVQAFDFKVE